MHSPRTTTLAYAIALLTAFAACMDEPPAKQIPPKLTKADRDRTLALSEPPGTSGVDETLRQRQRFVRGNDKKLDAWILLGRAWIMKAREASDPGYYLNASACADVALKLDPKSNLAFNLRGLVMLNNHQFAEARDLAAEILERDPRDSMALGTLSDALLELGQFAEASRIVQQMLDIKPNLPSYSRAAYVRWLEGDAPGAKQAIQLAYDAGRGQRDREPAAWTLVEAANMFWHEGDHEGAQAGYDFALAYNPSYPPALVGKARGLMRAGENAEAVGLLESAFTASPLARTAWLLGDARTAAGDTVGAAAAFEHVERIGKSSDHLTLALFYAVKNRDLAQAEQLARGELKTRRGIYVVDAAAWVLYRAGKLDEALQLAEQANRLGTKDAMLWYHLGAIELAAGKEARGKKRILDALALNDAFDVTGVAEARSLVSR